MRVSVTAESSVPVETAWRWWTDFGEPGEEMMLDHGIGKSRRRIVTRDDTRVVMDDELPLPGGRGMRMYRREVTFEDGMRFTERSEGNPPYEGTWRFESTPNGGTRIVREVDVKSGIVDFTGKVGERVTRELIERDLRHHIKEMEEAKGAREKR